MGPLNVAAVFIVSAIVVPSSIHVGRWIWLLLIPAAFGRTHQGRTRGESPPPVVVPGPGACNKSVISVYSERHTRDAKFPA